MTFKHKTVSAYPTQVFASPLSLVMRSGLRLAFQSLLVCLCLMSPAFAQGTASLAGEVRDGYDGRALAGVTLRVVGTQFGAISRADGSWELNNLPVGNLTLRASLVGYEPLERELEVTSGQNKGIILSLRQSSVQTSEVVVSAGKRVQAVQDVPVSISTVDQLELQQRNITRLDDALRYIPGVYVSKDQINVRGSSGFSLGLGSRVLILLDDFPLLSGDNGEVKFDALPIFNVKRIEVVKGAGSALYGTGALGGVVNILTADPSETPELRVRAFAGGYTLPREEWQYRETAPFLGGVDASYSRRLAGVDLLAAGGYKRNEGHHDYLRTSNWNGFVKFGADLTDYTRVKGIVNVARQERENFVFWKSLRAATSPPDDANPDERIVSDKLSAALSFEHRLGDKTFLILRSGVFRTAFATEPRLESSANDQLSSTSYAISNELQLNTILNEELILTAGLSSALNSITEGFLGDQNQRLGAAYLQAEYTPMPALILTGGGRFDIESTTGRDSELQFSPKLGATYHLSEDTRLRSSFGVGFRSPTLGERYSSLQFGGLTVAANPDLDPEKSWSLELGGATRLTDELDWELDLAVFYNQFRDLIEPQFPDANEPNIRFINITRARIAGAELGVKGWLPGRFAALELALTAMDPTDLDTDEILKYRSKWLAQGRVIIPFGWLEFQTDYRYQSRFDNIDEEIIFAVRNADARTDIHVFDMRLIANLYNVTNMPLRLTLNAKNVFNYYYTEIIANLAPMRSVTLQAEVKL